MHVTHAGSHVEEATLQNAIASNANGFILSVHGLGSAVLTVSGTFAATVNFEASSDGLTWYPLPTILLGTAGYGINTTKPGQYLANVTGQKSIRARINNYASGSITVNARATPLQLPSPATIIAGNRTTVDAYHSGNMLSGSSTDWLIRDTAVHSFTIEQASNNVYETDIVFASTLDQDVDIKIFPYFARGATANKAASRIFNAALKATDGIVVVAPERGLYVSETATYQHYEVKELRLPFTRFSIRIQATVAPTAGEFFLTVAQRY